MLGWDVEITGNVHSRKHISSVKYGLDRLIWDPDLWVISLGRWDYVIRIIDMGNRKNSMRSKLKTLYKKCISWD